MFRFRETVYEKALRSLPWLIIWIIAILVVLTVDAAWAAGGTFESSPVPEANKPAPSAAALHAEATANSASVPTQAAGAPASPAAEPSRSTEQPRDEHAAVLSFLSQTIGWYHQTATEETLAAEPAETLFVSDDRQMAAQVLQLAFQYARAETALLKAEKTAPTAVQAGVAGAPNFSVSQVPGLSTLMSGRDKAQEGVQKLQTQADTLKTAIAHATRRQRDGLERELSVVQSQLELARSRVDSYNAIVNFESAASAAGSQLSGLSGQIDQLESTVPQLATQAKTAQQSSSAAVPTTPAPSDAGLLGAIEAALRLQREQQAIKDRIAETKFLSGAVNAARGPLLTRLKALNSRADELAAQTGSNDVNANRQRQDEFKDLINRHKLVVDALLPLTKQGVVLQFYVASLQRWADAVARHSDSEMRRVVIGLGVLGFLLVAVFVAAAIWRVLTFRYVQDLRRRRQLLQVRKLTVAAVVVLVLLFSFANQLGTLATVMGLAAAGIALALQNVILSFAGYFFVTGRYGIRTGDRIQLAGISGDVIEIGLFKLALMELTGDGSTRQPTGRVVVFPNSIIFQSNGNLFKQAPGTNFVWNELNLTLAPECDYRLVEKRLTEVVEDVYARYRDTVQRQYRDLARDLSLQLESPRPQSRIRLGQNGIELTVRYPVDTRHAVQVADEVSRRVLDTIAQEPALRLAVPGTPNLQPVEVPPASRASAPAPGASADDGHAAPPAEVTANPRSSSAGSRPVSKKQQL
jgi:small-conductance mechanosensitive channel